MTSRDRTEPPRARSRSMMYVSVHITQPDRSITFDLETIKMKRCCIMVLCLTFAGFAEAQDQPGPYQGCTETICHPQPSTVKVTRVVYDCVCQEYCLPKRPCCGWLQSCCKDCNQCECPT